MAVQQLNSKGGTGGFTDWRIPNRKELLSIVETRCTAPAINSQIFPDTPDGPFFSSTPDSSVQTHARTVYFGTGGDSTDPKTSSLPIRLVR